MLNKNFIIMIHDWEEVSPTAEQELNSNIRYWGDSYNCGTQAYRCSGTSEPTQDVLRIILKCRSVVPKVQQEPINTGSGSEQTMADKDLVEALQQELQEQKRRAQEEADVFEKRIVEMQSKEESLRKEISQEREEQKRRAREEADMFKERIAEMQAKDQSTRKEISQELEEQKRRAQEEAEVFKERIAEMQSKLEEDRHTSGKASATYTF